MHEAYFITEVEWTFYTVSVITGDNKNIVAAKFALQTGKNFTVPFMKRLKTPRICYNNPFGFIFKQLRNKHSNLYSRSLIYADLDYRRSSNQM